jgi:acyl-CoA synthetase (AMP-forming)/AMP-acid ligase II
MSRLDAPTWSAMVAASRELSDLALISAESTWSGAELAARASGAATHLCALTSADRPVPALFTSTPTSFAYLVGGACARRAIAPLGPRLTEHELAPCVAALGAEVLLTEDEFAPLARAIGARTGTRVVTLSDAPRGDVATLECSTPTDATAFVLHTSGTTGTPKPVPYTQERLATRVRVNAALCSLDTDARYATASPFHHIAGFGNYAIALAAGATVVPLPRFSVETWRGLSDVGVTHALTVPTMLEMLLDARALALRSLRVLQYGAAPIHPDTLRRTLAALPDVSLVNLFGQTEGSPITCLTGDDHRAIVTDGRDELLQSVGRAAPGVEVWIDNPDLRGIGEVFARAEHFFRTDHDGVLRTGDIGWLDDAGYLFLVGRRGDKIVRGGENVYPLEVERVLEEHPAVHEAAVVGVADRHWGEVVKAFVVPTDSTGAPDPEDLRAHTRARLAGFKVPTEWAFVDALPRNAAGKLLRRRLVEATDPTLVANQ